MTMTSTTTPTTSTTTPTAGDADVVGAARRALTVIDRIVLSVRPEDLRRPTPCAGWAVRDLLAHVTTELDWMPALLVDAPAPSSTATSDAPAPSLPATTARWSRALSRADDAIERARLDRTVPTSTGPLPAHELLRELVCDLTVHTWDLAVALGVDPDVPDDLVATAGHWFDAMAPRWRAAGRVAGAVPTDTAGSPLDRLVAATGRTPVGPTVLRDAADAAALGTVLGVWAHPDDESYLSAALMGLASAAGNRVVCVTATNGELGTEDPDLWPPERLAPARARELTAALGAVGVHEHRLLGLPDGGLPGVDHDAARAQIAAVVDEVRPDTIVTFGPDGMTGHPDHRTVSRWVTDVWRAAGRPGRLLYATTTGAWARRFADVHEAVPAFGPGYPVRTPFHQLAVVVRPDATMLDRKVAALRSHATQTRPIEELIGSARFRAWWAEECFRAARP